MIIVIEKFEKTNLLTDMNDKLTDMVEKVGKSVR